ncbi:hypothetical protein ACF08M_37690 [Streptomyces sp. NPDC015032]|uniref:hypothetical protein n=1 Tax=Streptomyces sp. NPDC015032 TaxID=3364937 RepID=UPI0036FF8081
MSELTALPGIGVLAVGLGLAWRAFEDARRDAEASIANEDSYGAYADQWDTLLRVGAVVTVLLLVLAAVVLALLHTAHAVTVLRAPKEDGIHNTGELRRHTLGHAGAALQVQFLHRSLQRCSGAARCGPLARDGDGQGAGLRARQPHFCRGAAGPAAWGLGVNRTEPVEPTLALDEPYGSGILAGGITWPPGHAPVVMAVLTTKPAPDASPDNLLSAETATLLASTLT